MKPTGTAHRESGSLAVKDQLAAAFRVGELADYLIRQPEPP
jgi:hypothetical protein